MIAVARSRGAVGTAKHLYEHSQDLMLLLTGEDDLPEADLAWIAGDVRPMTQQVAVALGTGNITAVRIDQYLAVDLPTPPHDGGA